MRSRLALPLLLLLLLLCALLAAGKPDGRRKKGSRAQLLPARRRDSSRFEAKFLLYSKRAEQGCLIEPGQEGALKQCPFNASLPLVMIIHGWSVDRRLEGWIWKLAEELKTQLPDTNVVITDWLSLAHAHYPIAVQNTRDVGQEIARFLEWLEETVQFHRSKAHLVGYSLGAHVAGFAGSSMRGNGKIGRITGLDPAGPLFEGMSPTDRLSPDDANFVDAIHTFTQQHMGLSVGIKQPVAHFDFYPNGGTFQPGCHIMHVYNHIVQYGIRGLTQTVKCAHERSVHLFIDSLRHSQKQITGYWCKNMQMFDKGRCLDCRAHRCNILGYHIQKTRVPGSQRLFLKTQPQMPFKGYTSAKAVGVQISLRPRLSPAQAADVDRGSLKRCLSLCGEVRRVSCQIWIWLNSEDVKLVAFSEAPLSHPPVYHYQFKIHFIHEFQEPRIDPTFTISLTGNKDDVENLSITLIEGITQNKTYTFLVPLDIDIGELMMIKLKWEGTAIWENIWDTVQTIIPWRKGDRRPGLIVTSIRVKAGETQQKMTFCSQSVDNLHLYPGHEKMFVRCEVSAQKLK